MADQSIDQVDCTAYVVAGGLLEDENYARITVVLTPGISCSASVLSSWPSHGHDLLNQGSITALIFNGSTTTADALSLRFRDAITSYEPPRELVELWNRTVLSGEEAKTRTDYVLGFWNNSSRGTKTFEEKVAGKELIALPSLEAGLILPLERARQVLTSIATDSAPIRGLPSLRPHDWVPPPIARSRLDWNLNPDAMRNLKNIQTLDNRKLARQIVTDGDRSVLDMIQSMHARHHLAMHQPFAAGRSYSVRSDVQESMDPLYSRLSHLMGSPTLLRLFGFARDFVIEAPDLGQSHYALRFNSSAAGSTLVTPGCVTKHKPSFSPASNDDFKDPSSTWLFESDGILALDPTRYALMTLDPPTAIEGDANHYRNLANLSSQEKGEPPHNPNTGGLSLAKTVDTQSSGGTAPTSISSDSYLFAEDLVTFNRLDIGVVVADGSTQWRCPAHKLTRWSDPEKKVDIEKVLDSLAANKFGLRQFELDAAIFSDRATVTQVSGVPFHDTRLVTYNGEPLGIGLDQIYWEDPQGKPFWGRPTITLQRENGHISLTQTSRLPSTDDELRDALLPPLRFGLEYRVGVRRVYLGGACLSLAQATKLYENPEMSNACLPVPNASGFRFLRHEAVAPPLVALGPQLPKSDDYENWLQTPLNLALVSWTDYRPDPLKPARIPNGHVEVLHSERVVIPPTVNLNFAMLHEVFDHLEHGQETLVRRTALPGDNSSFPPSSGKSPAGKEANTFAISSKPPADGLQRLNLGKILRPAQPEANAADAAGKGKNDIRQGYVRVKIPSMGLPRIEALKRGAINDRQVPYYPDPAAATMMFALRLPNALDGDWLEPPQAASMRSDWPDVLPIYLRVIAGKVDAGKPRIRVSRPVPLVALRNQRVVPVTVTLPKAEVATLVMWFVPDVADLADWFDVAEQIQALLTNGLEAHEIAAATARDRGQSANLCALAAAKLLGSEASQRFAGILDPIEQRTAVAEMLVEALRHKPISQIAQPQLIALSHLVPVTLEVPRFDDRSPLALARRLGTDDEAIARFLGTSPPTTDWTGAYDEDGALQPVIGGAVEFDPASTSGLIFTGRLVAPTGSIDSGPAPASPNVMPADPPSPRFRVEKDGSIDLTPLRGYTEFLRIEGIPYPADGRQGLRRFDLRDLQLDAFNAQQGGIQVKRGAALQDGGARNIDLFVRLVPRHLPQLERSSVAEVTKNKTKRPRKPDQLDISTPVACGSAILRATIRPASPDIKELVPSFRWQGSAQKGSGEISWRLERYTTFRLILRRPWFSSGEDEQLGLIFWPPQVLDATQKNLMNTL